MDVVVPFHGSDDELDELIRALDALELSTEDSLVVVDNGPASAGRHPRDLGPHRSIIVERALSSSYHARNQGAGRGRGEWILFIDADVFPPRDLLDRYFDSPPGDCDGVLAGAVVDEVEESIGWRRPAARYAHLRAAMSQGNTLSGGGPWAYAQTANCAVRRASFEAVGGFTEEIRSGGDADLCFRLRQAGWSLQSRDRAEVVHRSRTTLRAMLRQRARHGSGARWLNEVYPGAFPRDLSAGTVLWSVRQLGATVGALVRRDADSAILLGVEVLSHWAFELGRMAPNRVTRTAGRTA